MTYSIDFRMKVLSIRERENLSMQEVADRFDIGVATVMRWTKKPVPKRTRQVEPSKLPVRILQEDREKYPNSYNYERARRLGVGTTTVWQALRKLNLTYKKNFKTSKCRS